jgi:hypothetical protein
MRLGRRIVAGLILGALAAFLISLLRPRRVPAYLAPDQQPGAAQADLRDPAVSPTAMPGKATH